MTPGYHRMPADKYLRDPCVVPSLSASVAKVILSESPRKAWFCHPRLNPNYQAEVGDQFDMGTAAHSMLLEDDASSIVVVDAENWRTKAAKEQRDAARAAGKTALLARHVKDVGAMVDAAQAFIAQSEIAEYWAGGESELAGIALDDGVWLRARFDRITASRRFITDYKSTTDVAPEVFSRQIVRMGYHVQEAFYRRVAQILGAVGPRFVFLAQSCEPPYECSLHACEPALQEIAEAQVQRAIDIWRECMKKKEWPSYGGRIHYATPPTYLINDHEMRMAA